MKNLLALVSLCAVTAFAQDKPATNILTPALDAAKSQVREEMQARQQKALLEEAKGKTSTVSNTGRLQRMQPVPQPVLTSHYNTNLMTPGFGLFIRDMDKVQPGFATNFTAAQRALTNLPPHLQEWNDRIMKSNQARQK